MKAFDLLVLAALIITAFGGYRSGLLQTVFKTIGYITGGTLGVALSVQLLSKYSKEGFKLLAATIIIFLLATLGHFILGKIGLGFRKVIFIPPFKFVDSLLGAILSIILTVFIIYLLSVILLTVPLSIDSRYISDSKFYTYTNLYVPKLITDFKTKVINFL